MDMSNNQFHGPIPQEIGLLFQLQYLDLGVNSLVGGIPPGLGSCLDLQKNNLDEQQSFRAGTTFFNKPLLSFCTIRKLEPIYWGHPTYIRESLFSHSS